MKVRNLVFCGALLGIFSCATTDRGETSKPLDVSQRPADAAESRQVEATMAENRAALEGCYRSQIGKGKLGAGVVETRFRIDEAGKVVKAEVASSTLKNAAVEECLVRTIQTIQFSRLRAGSEIEATYPYRFTRDK